MALLAAYKLEKAYGGRTLFQDVSFEVADKDHIGLVGDTAREKTTLMQITSWDVQKSGFGLCPSRKTVACGLPGANPRSSWRGRRLCYELVLRRFRAAAVGGTGLGGYQPESAGARRRA